MPKEEKKIAKLSDSGFDARAKLVSEKAMVENKELMTAFRAVFDFCPVYFIDEQGVTAIRENKISEAIFLNDELATDPSIKCDAGFVLVAEYGQTWVGNTKAPEKTNESGEGAAVEAESYNTKNQQSSELAITGLIVKNSDFMQLWRPFPFYVKENKNVLKTREKEEMVRILNQNFKNFYNKVK